MKQKKAEKKSRWIMLQVVWLFEQEIFEADARSRRGNNGRVMLGLVWALNEPRGTEAVAKAAAPFDHRHKHAGRLVAAAPGGAMKGGGTDVPVRGGSRRKAYR